MVLLNLRVPGNPFSKAPLLSRCRSIVRAVCCFAAAIPLLASVDSYANGSEPTHKQLTSIKPEHDGKTYTLNTFVISPEGQLWLACSNNAGSASNKGCLIVKEPTGASVNFIELDFSPTAANFASDGSLFVAGSGFIARLSADGQVQKTVNAPNLLNPEEMKEKLEAATKKMIAQVTATYDEQLKRIDEQLEELRATLDKADTADKRAVKRSQARIDILEQQRKSYEENIKSISESYSSMYSDGQSFDRAKRSTGIAVSKRDLFVSLPSLEGYGYTIWRMDHQLENAVQVKGDVGGCCGQLDIQSDGENLLIAENTAFRVGIYDREGKDISGFGKRSREGEQGWGSCCNPMNIRCLANGDILTAESSIGDIKRYSKSGEYLGKIGSARIGGGCKHVALAVDSQRDWYFMMNQGAGDIVVLVPLAEAPDETPDEILSREARNGLGQKLLGAWKMKKTVEKTSRKSALGSLASGIFSVFVSAADDEQSDENVIQGNGMEAYILSMYPALHFHADGNFSTALPASETTPKTVAAAISVESVRRWEAVKQTTDSEMTIGMIEDGVRSFGAEIKFVDDNTLTAQWFYDNASNPYGQSITYERVAGACCGEGKPCECDEECDTPATKKASAPDTSTFSVPVESRE